MFAPLVFKKYLQGHTLMVTYIPSNRYDKVYYRLFPTNKKEPLYGTYYTSRFHLMKKNILKGNEDLAFFDLNEE